MSGFELQVASFITETGNRVVPGPDVLSTPFPVLAAGDKNLVIHCIPLCGGNRFTDAPSFFSDLTTMAELQSIKLVHLWEDVWHNHSEVVKGRLRTLLGSGMRIHARQTEVIRLDKEKSSGFLKVHHLQGDAGAYYKYGLMHGKELAAVITFSKSRVMTDGPVLYRSYELVRYACKTGTIIVGGLGKLIHYFIENQRPDHLMTYADRDWGTGEGYKKLGFVFAGNSVPVKFYLDPRDMARQYPHHLPARLFKEAHDGPADLDHLMKTKGYAIIYTAGNAKLILDKRKF